MAKAPKTNLTTVGRIGNTVTYTLKGQTVQRSIGKNNKAPSLRQRAIRQRAYLSNNLLRPTKEFIDIGFKAKIKGTTWNTHNAATSYTLLNAITGEYPDQKIDYSKVLFSQGKMPKPAEVAVTLVSTGLKFTWKVGLETKYLKLNDQVMVMAFLPGENDAIYELNIARRFEGMAFFKLPRYAKSIVLETYISFISTNHKKVSNSIYTGQFIWKGHLYK